MSRVYKKSVSISRGFRFTLEFLGVSEKTNLKEMPADRRLNDIDRKVDLITGYPLSKNRISERLIPRIKTRVVGGDTSVCEYVYIE